MDNGGGSSCIQRIVNMKLTETIDMVLSDLVNFDKDSSVCSPCLCVRVSTPTPPLHVTRRVPNGTVVVVPGLWPMNHAIVSEVLYLCYWHSQESSPLYKTASGLHHAGTWPTCMFVIYVYFAICVCPVICCSFLHALLASQISLTFV